MKYKICKNCGTKNDIDEPFCTECMEAEFEIVDEDKEINQEAEEKQEIQQEKIDTNKTILDMKKPLKLKNQEFTLIIEEDKIIGRENFGAKYLSNYLTTSRAHLKVFYKDNKWMIEDLNSTNGTFLNGVKITPNKEYEIKENDIIKLSSKVEFRVEI